MNLENLIVYCIEIGPAKHPGMSTFGWARFGKTKVLGRPNYSSLESLGDDFHQAMSKKVPLAIGFSCPLYIPFRENHPYELTKKRDGDGKRFWSEGAGVTNLVTGLVEIMWLISKINKFNKHLSKVYHPCLEWSKFEAGKGLPIFFWEAFIRGSSNTVTPHEQTLKAAEEFAASINNLPNPEKFHSGPILSLIGTAILHSRWSKDLSLFHTKTVVVGAPKRVSTKRKQLRAQKKDERGWFM